MPNILSKRHKWCARHNGTKKTGNKGGSVEACLKCGCVREYVGGVATYFIDDTVYDRYAPPCDNRNVGLTEPAPRLTKLRP